MRRLIFSFNFRYSVVIFIYSDPLVVDGSTFLFGSRVALNPWLGGVRDVASAVISHQLTQSNGFCCFQTLDAVFPKDLLSEPNSVLISFQHIIFIF